MRRLRAAKRVQTQHCPSFNVGCKKRLAEALYSLGILRSMTLQYCKQRCFAMSHEESASIGEFIDAVWLEEAVPALHDFTLRLLFLELLPALMILSVRC